ncbi:methyltransferase domain-containing protein [Nocardioides sp. CCNWLW239]|uniref:class I SAM-dependent methyltransferase n=1 Tax=Nocardioides sp. CCNWLW239 TaxID=3128902 RepID=UPI003015EDEA
MPTVEGARKRLVRAARELAGLPADGAEPDREHVTGVVEVVLPRQLVGWVSVPADAPPTRVDLYVGRVRLSSTYANPDVPMVGVSHQVGRDRGWTFPRVKGSVPGPRGDNRHSREQVRSFAFRIGGIWDYARRGTKVSVRVGEQWLPISGHGMWVSPSRRGELTPTDLEARLAEGWVLSQMGDVQLSKRHDRQWQADVIGIYDRVRAIFAETFGYDLFVVYGTLLGAVREGGFIAHDADFDAAYISREGDGAAASEELTAIGIALIEAGFKVHCMVACLHVIDPADPENRIDIFHTYFDGAEPRRWRLPFGIAGTSTLTSADWRGTEEVALGAHRVLAPVAGEEVVRHLYGDDWRLPKPGFNWSLERTDAATEGAFTPEQRSRIYWSDFYARHGYQAGSSFSEFMLAFPGSPHDVVDIGCGDGRDACAFAAAGHQVTGVDQAVVGIEHAAKRAAELGLPVSFATCDVADRDQLGAVLRSARDGEAPMTFYLRFLLHAISEDAQTMLLDTIEECARPGDLFAAEFRTDQDAAQVKVHGKHFRRFQSAAAFRADLEDVRGWRIEHFEEGSGLSPYQDEDPVLARVVARR